MTELVADGVTTSDNPSIYINHVLAELAAVSDAPSIYINHVLSELATLSDAPSSLRSRRGLALDGLRLADALLRHVLTSASDAAKLSDAYALSLAAQLSDLARTSDQPLRRLYTALGEGVALADYFTRVLAEALEEGLELADRPVTGLRLTLVESVELSELLAGLRRVVTALGEGVELADTLVGLRRLFGNLGETAVLAGVLVLQDTEYNAWVVNTHTLGLSRYSGYNFNSISEGLGAREDGIYLLEGADDAGTPIEALIRTGFIDFGMTAKKSNPYAYLTATVDGRLLLKVRTSQDGAKVEDWYEMTEAQSTTDNSRFQIGRGLKARFWQYELANVNGADFEAADLRIPVVLTKRRI